MCTLLGRRNTHLSRERPEWNGRLSLHLYAREGGNRVRARMFAPLAGIVEDPATGSANGPLGAYLAAYTDILTDNSAEFVSHQGVEMGRKSELFVRLARTAEGVQVSVGGGAVRVGEGTLFL